MNNSDLAMILVNIIIPIAMFFMGFALGKLHELKRSLMFMKRLHYELQKAIDKLPKKRK